MTRDEIQQLKAGEETDALVDTLILNRDVCRCRLDGMMHYLNDNKTCRVCDKPIAGRRSTDIAAVWKVAEKVVEILSTPGPLGGSRAATFGFYHSRVRQISYDYKYYQAYFKPPKGDAFSAMGDTAPLAICKAALLAVGV